MKNNRPHWADTAIAIFSGLMLLTYVTGNYFACQQMKLTQATLDEVRKGGSDSHDLATAAKAQADSSKAIAESATATAAATKHQASISAQAANAARLSADTSAKQLELAERPWISVSAVLSGPLQYDTNGANITMRVTVNNYGHSPATNVEFAPELFVPDLRTSWAERDQFCENLTKRKVFGSDGVRIREVAMPGVPLIYNVTFNAPTDWISAYRSHHPTYSFVLLSPILCVAYSSTFDPNSSYYTGIYYSLLRRNPARPDQGTAVPVGEPLSMEELQLRTEQYASTIR